ncbi:MAG: M23 family metallopeptidase [Bacilli bacterium]|nr:M23 family metallopeptidase [Bacilli bacterium]
MCDNPNVLEAMYIVKTIITIIKVLVPIMLIVFISLDYAGAVKSGDEDVMKKANKATVTKIIAGVCIFLVPMFVDVVIRFSSNGSVDVNDCYTNATKENIQSVYETRASEAVARAETSLSYSDYSQATVLVSEISNTETRTALQQRLSTVKKTIDEKNSNDDPIIVGGGGSPGGGGGTGQLPSPGGSSSSGDASCYKGCRSSEPDPSAVINCWPGIVSASNFIYPTAPNGQKLGSWPKNYSSIPTQLSNPKVYSGEFIIPVTPVNGTYNFVYEHNGIDFMAVYGTPVYSPVDGTLIYSEWGHTTNKSGTESSYTVSIKMNKSVNVQGTQVGQIFMTHLSGIVYRCAQGSCNQSVKKGQLIGFSGNAAGSTCGNAGWAPHLHMTMHPVGNYSGGIGTSKIQKLYNLTSGMKLQAGG